MPGKVILLTGASSGIGYETAVALARQGHKVYGAARRLEKMQPLAEYGVVPVKMDLTVPESVEAAVEQVIAAEGHIDVLVNNAGYGYFGSIENVPMEDARREIEVNVFGLAAITRLVLPHMRERRSGRIVNIASIAGRAPFYYGGWYNVSKYAVEAFSDALRMEMKPFGVDVCIIEPGPIKTDWGIIAAQHLCESCGETAYSDSALTMAGNIRRAYSSNLFPGPEVISRAILRAVNSRRPRTRYHAGPFSCATIFFHTLLPDRWWDALMRILGRREFRV